MEGMVLDIQRASIHDGPGVRTTVFLKGCPLRCAWCHNPESQSPRAQLSYHSGLCTDCGLCAQVCPAGVHRWEEATDPASRDAGREKWQPDGQNGAAGTDGCTQANRLCGLMRPEQMGPDAEYSEEFPGGGPYGKMQGRQNTRDPSAQPAGPLAGGGTPSGGSEQWNGPDASSGGNPDADRSDRPADRVHRVDYSKCTGCGACTQVCPASALTLYGRKMTAQQVVRTVCRDRVFYEQSGGGMTLSGGEPLSQADFAAEILRLCRAEGIHTCLETSGMGSCEAFASLLPYVDLVYFDWKVPDDPTARQYIGADLGMIQKNLDFCMASGKAVLLRCPIIPGVNDNGTHFAAIGDLLQQYPSLLGAELLPYHDFGVDKAAHIGGQMQRFQRPDEQACEGYAAWFADRGISRVTLAK